MFKPPTAPGGRRRLKSIDYRLLFDEDERELFESEREELLLLLPLRPLRLL